MGDWADDMALRIVRGVKLDTIDEGLLAIELRSLLTRGQTEGIKDASARIRAWHEGLEKQGLGLGGGDK